MLDIFGFEVFRVNRFEQVKAFLFIRAEKREKIKEEGGAELTTDARPKQDGR